MAEKLSSEDFPTRHSSVAQSHARRQAYLLPNQAGPSQYRPSRKRASSPDDPYTLVPASVQRHEAVEPRTLYEPRSQWLEYATTDFRHSRCSVVDGLDPNRGQGSSTITADTHRDYDPKLPPLSGSTPVDRLYSNAHLDFVPDALPVGRLVPETEPARARVACSFCRTRKLKCDGASPCRHCERRNMECTYAITSTRAKASANLVGSKASRPMITAPSEHPYSKKRSRSDSNDGNWKTNGSRKRSKEHVQVTRLCTESHMDGTEEHLDVVLPSSRRVSGSDLAMIQNDVSTFSKQPESCGRDGWWGEVFTILGANRQVGNKLVCHLLTRFVQSNAIFFGLLHAPTLLDIVASHGGYRKADPALYLSVLAVSACDMHRNYVADERTADMRASSEVARNLASKLSKLAFTFLQASTTEEGGLTPAVGQAASILALVQSDGSSAQEDLINLAENVVRKLKLHESITAREPLLQDCEPDSDLYWSRPVASDSPGSEVKYESIVRLCWTGLSHRFRRLIALPDEDLKDSNLPDFILHIRPMAFWQPSLLPDHLPPPFFHSQDLMRRSAHLSRLAISLAQVEQLKEIDGQGQHGPDTPAKVRQILASLDKLELAFVRHRPQTEGERHNVLGRTLQMFCRMHVWVRLTIWRRYRMWSSPQSAKGQTSSKDTSTPLPFQEFHPTVDYWLAILNETTARALEDFDSHVVDQTALQTTVSDLDSLIRHTSCALDIVEASGHTAKVLPTVTASLNILKRFVSISQGRKDLPQFDAQMIAKTKLASDRCSRLQPDQN